VLAWDLGERRLEPVLFVGVDWAEDHHDVCVLSGDGRVIAKGRVPDSVEGLGRVHEMIGAGLGENEDDPRVLVGIETDRGVFVRALLGAGYELAAVNPLSVDRYRDRHRVSGAKSDPGDARVLADMMRTDGHLHRRVAGDSDEVEAIKLVARAHQNAIWSRRRISNQLRSSLREFYPAAIEAFDQIGDRDSVAVLAVAPTPSQGRILSKAKIASALRRGGRKLNVDKRTEHIYTALRAEHLTQPAVIETAYGNIVTSLARLVTAHSAEIAGLEEALAVDFTRHPEAEIYLSQPGLGIVTSSRVLGEFGDDPNRFDSARNRRNYAGTSPLTIASGGRRVVRARFARNDRLGDAINCWAFNAMTRSPGAQAFYAQRRAKGDRHNQALRALGNRLVSILHGCLRHGTPYDEHTAWGHRTNIAA
jgi:transposase